MPMGNGKLFLPVKAAIRKNIGKEAGDFVRIILFKDETSLTIPNEIIGCLKNESNKVYNNFLALTEGQQKAYLDWIYSAKKEDTKAARIIKMLDRIMLNKTFYDFD